MTNGYQRSPALINILSRVKPGYEQTGQRSESISPRPVTSAASEFIPFPFFLCNLPAKDIYLVTRPVCLCIILGSILSVKLIPCNFKHVRGNIHRDVYISSLKSSLVYEAREFLDSSFASPFIESSYDQLRILRSDDERTVIREPL